MATADRDEHAGPAQAEIGRQDVRCASHIVPPVVLSLIQQEVSIASPGLIRGCTASAEALFEARCGAILRGFMTTRTAKSALPRQSGRSKSRRAAGGSAREQGLASPLATALHHQIFLVLRDRILSGMYPTGSLLPSEEKLSRMFRVSRVTLRAALATLAGNGLIERRQGIGTFISRHIEPPRIHAPMSDLLAHIADVGRSTQVKLLELGSVRGPLHVRSLFNCEADQIFQRAVRLRSAHNLPIFYVVTYVPGDIARRFTRREMRGPSLYQLLRGEGFNFKAGKQIVSAALADPTVAAALDVEVGAPLLQIRRIHFDERMQPFEYMEMLASPALFELQMTLGSEDFPV
jgi:GntR family transcriptional regulator